MTQLIDMLSNKVGWPTELEVDIGDIPTVEFDQDGYLKKSPFSLISRHLVPTTNYSPHSSFTFTVILNSRAVVPPNELLADVCTRCALTQNEDASDGLIKLLAEWTDVFPYDFIDDKTNQQLKSAVGRILTLYPSFASDISLLNRTLNAKKAAWKKYESILLRIQEERDSKMKESNISSMVDIMELCPSPNMLAKQLTHIELERLSMIGPDELINALLRKETDKNRPKNLQYYIDWFNRLSLLAATNVCQFNKRKDRVKILDYWMDVAKECMQLANFNSFMAIIYGLNTPPISRLKRTWSKAHTDKFEALEKHLSPMSNFSTYRQMLNAAMWRSTHGLPIVVPCFSVFVKDAVVMAEDSLGGSCIKWEKWWMVAKHIAQLIQWKSVECPFDRSPTILNYLLTNPILDEKQLDILSYECEPPGNSYEKEAFKKLKQITSNLGRNSVKIGS